MAAIIRDDKQDNALVEIEAALAVVKQLNAMLEKRDGSNAFQVAMLSEKGRGSKVDVCAQEMKFITAFCTKYRTRLVKEIRTKAEKYRISLDKNDQDIISAGDESTEDHASDMPDGEDGEEYSPA